MLAKTLFATALYSASVLGRAVQARDGECTVELSFSRGQNPIAGGDNTFVCTAKLHYADGSEETINDECRYVTNNHCFPSKLPFTICTHTNGNLEDGYIDYADQHVDFHDDGCHRDSYAGPAGDGATQTCKFPC